MDKKFLVFTSGGELFGRPKIFLGEKFQDIFFFPNFFLQKYFVFLTSFPFFFFFIFFVFSFFNYQILRLTPPHTHTHILPGGVGIQPRSYRFRPFPQRRGSEKYGGGGNLNRLVTFNKFYLTFYYFFCYFCFHSGKKFNKKAVKSQVKSIKS